MRLPAEEVKKIVVFRALQLGDILCAIPALRALRKAYPLARISYVGLPHTLSLIERFPACFDDFIEFPGYPGLPEQAFDEQKFAGFIKKIKKRGYDLAIQMQGNGSIVNPLVKSFGAKYNAGFCEHLEEENALFLKYPDYGHEIKRHLALMEHLGIPASDTRLEFPIREADTMAFQELNLPVEANHYVCIHPGSRGSWRQWPPLYFAAVADFCAEQGFKVIITGTKEELELAQQIGGLMRHMPLICSGKTSLGAVAVLIKNSFGLIANCTGVSHIAAALETPSVIISMDGEPERWGPLNATLHHTIDWTKKQDYNEVFKEVVSLFSDNKRFLTDSVT
jgi:ADP-heptose:LPS heptosyltransferase